MTAIRNGINIAEFKAHMGKYLKLVRQGKEVILKDRDFQIAKIVPIFEDESALVVDSLATNSVNALVKFTSPPIKKLADFDSLKILQDLREDKR